MSIVTVTHTHMHDTVQSQTSNFQPYVGISLLALCEQFLDPMWAFLLALCERLILGPYIWLWVFNLVSAKKGSLHSCWLVLKTFSLSLNCNWKYLKESQDQFLKFFWTLILTIRVSFSLDPTLLKNFSKCQIKTMLHSSREILKAYWSRGSANAVHRYIIRHSDRKTL